MITSDEIEEGARRLAAFSSWVDNWNLQQGRNREALGWHRVCKAAEEAGEAISAWLLFIGGNPRKPKSRSDVEVVEELLDTAVAALGAVEHLRGNRGVSLDLLLDKIGRVHERAMSL